MNIESHQFIADLIIKVGQALAFQENNCSNEEKLLKEVQCNFLLPEINKVFN